MERFVREQYEGYGWDRLAYDNTLVHEKGKVGSFLPMHVEPFDIQDLERLCLLHHFNMAIAYSAMEEEDCTYMDCYEYTTFEPPSRTVVERYMRDMLYKNNS
jgi:hypothetical protein